MTPLAALAAAALLAGPPQKPTPPPPFDEAPILQAAAREDWLAVERLSRQAAAAAPRDWRPWLWVGVALVNQGKDEEGEIALRRGIAVEDNAVLRHRLGQLLLRSGRYAEAENSLQRATRLAEGDLVYADLARAQLRQGKDRAAERSLARARALSPNPRAFEDVQTELANRAAVKKLTKPAVAALSQAERAEREGTASEVEKAWREVVKLAPAFGEGHHRLGRVLWARGDRAGAEPELRLALQTLELAQVRSRAEAADALARLLLDLGRDAAQARSWAEQAIALRGERPEYLATLARACEAEGRSECAVDAWEKVATAPEAPAGLRREAVERLRVLRR